MLPSLPVSPGSPLPPPPAPTSGRRPRRGPVARAVVGVCGVVVVCSVAHFFFHIVLAWLTGTDGADVGDAAARVAIAIAAWVGSIFVTE